MKGMEEMARGRHGWRSRGQRQGRWRQTGRERIVRAKDQRGVRPLVIREAMGDWSSGLGA